MQIGLVLGWSVVAVVSTTLRPSSRAHRLVARADPAPVNGTGDPNVLSGSDPIPTSVPNYGTQTTTGNIPLATGIDPILVNATTSSVTTCTGGVNAGKQSVQLAINKIAQETDYNGDVQEWLFCAFTRVDPPKDCNYVAVDAGDTDFPGYKMLPGGSLDSYTKLNNGNDSDVRPGIVSGATEPIVVSTDVIWEQANSSLALHVVGWTDPYANFALCSTEWVADDQATLDAASTWDILC